MPFVRLLKKRKDPSLLFKKPNVSLSLIWRLEIYGVDVILKLQLGVQTGLREVPCWYGILTSTKNQMRFRGMDFVASLAIGWGWRRKLVLSMCMHPIRLPRNWFCGLPYRT